MTRSELIKKVALRMDELTPSSAFSVPVDGISYQDENPLYALIDGLADDCALELYSIAPYWRLPNTEFAAESKLIESIDSNDANSRKIIRLKLADDFLRVAEINCEEFKRPITEVAPEQSAEGKRQHNRYLMGKETKPVGVLSFAKWLVTPDNSETPVEQNCREIDCYSLSPDSTLTASGVVATYIAKPANAESVSDLLMPSLEWLTAARAFGARGDANHAAICQQNAQNLLV